MLVVPAAGAGTRLKSHLPKLLVPVAGRAMIDHIIGLYAPFVDRVVVVVSPAALEASSAHLRPHGVLVDLAVQERPTGMLDAILIPRERLAAGGVDEVWVTWCDQVAVQRETVAALAEHMALPDAALVFPTCAGASPYIHFERDATGRIVGVRQRREGDLMPAAGESDMGLFAMRTETYLERLPAFARDTARGAGTGERNFLPFIPWLAAHAQVSTFPCHHPMEAVGINTPKELRAVEIFLNQPGGGSPRIPRS